MASNITVELPGRSSNEDSIQEQVDAAKAEIVVAGNVQIGLVQDEGTAQIALVGAAGTTVSATVTAATDSEVARVVAEGDTQVARVEAAGDDELVDIAATGTVQIGLVEDTGTAVMSDIDDTAAAAAMTIQAALGTLNGTFLTAAAGLTAVAEGQQFAVPTSNGYGATIYTDVGGKEIYQYRVPYGRGFDLVMGKYAERAQAGATYPFTVDIDIAFVDAKYHDGFHVPNRALPDAPEARNVNFSTTGWIRNATGTQVNPTITPYNAQGPGGAGPGNTATHVVYTANQILYIHRTSGGAAMAGGKYALEFWAKTETGEGSKTLKAGSSGTLTDCVVPEGVWTKFQVEFTLAEPNTEDVVIRTGTGVTCDCYIDRVRLVRGYKEGIPSWDSVTFAGYRPSPSSPSKIAMTGDAMNMAGADFRGGIVYDANFKTGGTTFTRVFVVVSFSCEEIDAAQANYIVSSDHDTVLGVTSGSFQIGLEQTSTFEGNISFEPVTDQTRQYLPTDFRSCGTQTVGVLLDNNGANTIKKLFVGKGYLAKKYSETAANLGPIRMWRIGANNGDSKDDKVAFNFPGKVVHFLVKNLPSDYTQQQLQRLMRAVEVRNRLRDIGSVGITCWNLLDGDSNDVMASGDWTNIISRRGWLGLGGGDNNLFHTNLAVGGAGMTHGTTQYPQHMADEGWAIVQAAVDADLPIPVWLRGWTNDYQDVSNDWEACFEGYKTLFYNVALNMGPKVYLNLSSPLTKNETTTYANFNVARFLLEDAMHEWADGINAAAGYTRVWINDITGSATLGSTLEGTTTHYYMDGLHLNQTYGDPEMAALMRPGARAMISYIRNRELALRGG